MLSGVSVRDELAGVFSSTARIAQPWRGTVVCTCSCCLHVDSCCVGYNNSSDVAIVRLVVHALSLHGVFSQATTLRSVQPACACTWARSCLRLDHAALDAPLVVHSALLHSLPSSAVRVHADRCNHSHNRARRCTTRRWSRPHRIHRQFCRAIHPAHLPPSPPIHCLARTPLTQPCPLLPALCPPRLGLSQSPVAGMRCLQ